MNDITAIIPVAPIPSNPSSEVLDQTIESILQRLPDIEIIIMFDAVPAWLMELKPAYEEFKSQMLWRCEHDDKLKNVTPVVFESHSHQSTMTRKVMDMVRTSQLLWSEQDTPLHDDIPFSKLSEVVKAGYANSVRFYHEASVHPEHQYLFLDQKPIDILGVPLLRNRQWSGRPHLASTEFYRQIIKKYWRDNMFIEQFMYGYVVEGSYDEFRLHMYAPKGTLVRSLHLDGRRKGAANYDPRPS